MRPHSHGRLLRRRRHQPVNPSVSANVTPRRMSIGAPLTAPDLPFTRLLRHAGRSVTALVERAGTVHRGPLPSGALAAFLAARTLPLVRYDSIMRTDLSIACTASLSWRWRGPRMHAVMV